MIVVDSSALIEYYRPAGDEAVRRRVAEVIAADRLTVNGLIRVELLAFAHSEAEKRLLADDFAAFHHLPLTDAEFDLAAELGFELRRGGVTVPPTDLIVAASALVAGTPLYHRDAHFSLIAEACDLEARDLAVG